MRPLAFYGDETIGVRLHNLTPEVSIVAMPYGRYMENEEGRPRHDLLLAAGGRQHDPGARQDHRLLRQLRLRQDRRAARRVRRSDRAEPRRPRGRGLGRELLPGPQRRAADPARDRQRPRGHHAAHDPRARARRARRSRRRALDRPHRDSARRRSVLLRHGRPDRRDHARRSPADRVRAHGADRGARCASSTSTSCAESAPKYRGWCHAVYADATPIPARDRRAVPRARPGRPRRRTAPENLGLPCVQESVTLQNGDGSSLFHGRSLLVPSAGPAGVRKAHLGRRPAPDRPAPGGQPDPGLREPLGPAGLRLRGRGASPAARDRGRRDRHPRAPTRRPGPRARRAFRRPHGVRSPAPRRQRACSPTRKPAAP